jgi:hypothetical protein
MSDIKELIPLMNASEQKGFVEYLQRRNKRSDAKNVDLFKSIVAGTDLKLKVKLGTNAFNVLKKRTSDNLISYLAGITMESHASDEIDIIKDILISRRLFIHRKFKLAFKLLKRAESTAQSLGHYALLNEIYHTFIEYSYHELSPNQEDIFKRFEANQQNFLAQERTNMAYASIKRAFNEAEFKGADINVAELFEQMIGQFGLKGEEHYNFHTIYQLAHLVDIYGSQSRKYHAIDTFFEGRIEELKNGPTDNEKFLLYHIDLLYTMANIYFRKKNFSKSMVYLDDMKEQLERFDRKFYKERLPHYATLKTLCLNFSGKHEEAFELLDEILNSKGYLTQELLNLTLTKAMMCFQQGDLKETSSILAKYQHTDSWYEKNCGIEWTLNKNYMEILLHIELGNYDFVDSRISSLLRRYKSHLKLERNEPVLPFLKLVRRYYHNPEIITTEEFREEVANGINWKSIEEEDIFFLSFFAWLKAKMNKVDIYSTTLDILSYK